MSLEPVSGFSKLSKEEKINWLISRHFGGERKSGDILRQYWNQDEALQRIHEEFSENSLSNFYMPYGIAPNFLVDGESLSFPMVVEESSVVAAASKAAKFWWSRGGFKTTLLGLEKIGHTHFIFRGEVEKLRSFFDQHLLQRLFEETSEITRNMRGRGGGITQIDLVDKTSDLEGYFQLKASFNTGDSMGANFINSCLECFSRCLRQEVLSSEMFNQQEKDSLQVVMSILSNFNPDCLVRAEVSCHLKHLGDEEMPGEEFARKFKLALDIAKVEPYRAVTHNKGIMNGVDAVVLATGNDFRAVEASAHAYAAKDSRYTSLTDCRVQEDVFRFWIDLPLSVGVVGGLTRIHPLAKFSLSLLGDPSAEKLMRIIAVSGLAQNFAAVRSLVTTGIQKGHMKMHLFNVLNQIGTTQEEKKHLVDYFKNRTVSYHEVLAELTRFRGLASSLDQAFCN